MYDETFDPYKHCRCQWKFEVEVVMYGLKIQEKTIIIQYSKELLLVQDLACDSMMGKLQQSLTCEMQC